MVVIKREADEENGPEEFRLLKNTLRQPRPGFCYREIKRAELRRLFRSKPLANGNRCHWVDAKFGDSTFWIEGLWTAYYYSPKDYRADQLSVGCVIFTPAETKIIRRWALARKA